MGFCVGIGGKLWVFVWGVVVVCFRVLCGVLEVI